MNLLQLRSKLLIAFVASVLAGFSSSCVKKSEKGSTPSTATSDGKKVFQHYRTSAHKTLDPMKQFDQASAQVVSNVYDRLLGYDYFARPYKLVPVLLEKMPEKQEDGLTYLFTVKKGVVFHDDAAFKDGKGRELKVDDVIYSLKRFADTNVNTLSYVLLEGFIEGLDAFRDESKKQGKAFDYDKHDVSGIKKLSDYTFTLKFTRPNPLALYPFAFSGMSIVAREAVEKYGDDFGNHPVGTGPFYMKTYSRRGIMVLAKNEKYHMSFPSDASAELKASGALKDAGKKLPLVDEVHLPLIEETQPAMLKFKRGELHWIGMNKDEFNNMAYRDASGEFHLKKDFASKFDMYTAEYLSVSYLKFGMDDPIVGKNKALRQAIAYALNARGFVDLMLNSRGVPLNTIIPIPIAGSEKDVGPFWYESNLEMAKKKLAEAGYPDGKGLPELVVEYRGTNKDVRQMFEFVRNELAAAGIKMRANFQTFSNFLKKTNAGNFQIADAGWGADYPDAENFYQLLYSKNKAPGPNDGNFSNAEYDKLYETIKYMEHGPERLKLFKTMNEIIKEEVPLILRYNPLAFGLVQKNVRNLQRNMMDEYPYMYLDIN